MSPRPRDRLGRPLPPGSADERRYGEPERAVCSFGDALDKAVELFDAQRFFEAHEFFEHLWKSPEASPDDRGFWKGLAQVAVGFCHLQRGNRHGALTLLERACAQLAPYPALHHGIATGRMVAAARTSADRLRAGMALQESAPSGPLRLRDP